MKINKPTPFLYRESPIKSQAFDKLMTEFGKIPTNQINIGSYSGVTAPKVDGTFNNAFADVKNPYANMDTENFAEDLTVDQKAFNLRREQTAQGQADMLDAMRSGGGFNAGNIQALANQQSQAAASASADIGAQEQNNQALKIKGAEDVQRRRELMASGQSQADMARMGGAQSAQDAKNQFGLNQAQMQLTAQTSNQQASLQQNQMQYQAAQDARNFQANKIQGQMALQAGRDEAALANEQANKSWWDRMFG
jgi:hypothetical protein